MQDWKVEFQKLGNFDEISKDWIILSMDWKRLLKKLPMELQVDLDIIDKDNLGYVTMKQFEEFVKDKMEGRRQEEALFRLMSDGKDTLTLGQLKRVCDEMQEKLTDEELQEMMIQAGGSIFHGIGIKEFRGLLKDLNLRPG